MEPSGSEASEARSKEKGNAPVIDVDSENVNQRVDEHIDEHVSDQVDEQKRAIKIICVGSFSLQSGSKDKKKQTKLSFKPATMGESGVTVDNASSNDGAIRRLRTLLKRPSTILNCKYMHLRCAHIINLVVRDGLEEQNSSICKIQNAVKLELTERDYPSYFNNETEDGMRVLDGCEKKKLKREKERCGGPNDDDCQMQDPRNKLKYPEFCLDTIYPKSRTEMSNQGDHVPKRLKTLSAKTIEICGIVEDALRELYDGAEKRGDSSFDVLGWWNQNMAKFPILSQVAKHVLMRSVRDLDRYPPQHRSRHLASWKGISTNIEDSLTPKTS
ncbi:zinc finger BED domain-containing protein RICESLEEPER 2-like protein [Tanacetum coccineum]